jgi:hypothetical protein
MRRRDFLHPLISSLALSQAAFARNQSQSATELAQTFEATRQKRSPAEAEMTLSRELRTPPLPATRVPVGYLRQNAE